MICDDLPMNSMVDLPIAGPHTDLRTQCCTSDEKTTMEHGMLTYDNHGKLGVLWDSPAKINGI